MAEEHEAQWYEDEEPREYDVGEESHSGAGNDLHLDRLRSRSRRAPPDHRRRIGLPSRGRRVDDEIVDARRHGRHLDGRARSEEHTSELQSLMRISYAVFCLKKKKQTQKYPIINVI